MKCNQAHNPGFLVLWIVPTVGKNGLLLRQFIITIGQIWDDKLCY